MKKLYCKNCKSVVIIRGDIADCNYRVYETNIYNGVNKEIEYGILSDNEYGSCKYYKKKWYKFFIK